MTNENTKVRKGSYGEAIGSSGVPSRSLCRRGSANRRLFTPELDGIPVATWAKVDAAGML
jgi:hypothetical protein